MTARGEAAEAAAALTAAVTAAEQLTDQPDQTTWAMVTGSSTAASATPGNTAELDVITGVHAWARATEAAAFREVTGRDRAPRGGSDANTYAALARLGDLALALPRDRPAEVTPGPALGERRALALPAMDEAVPWRPIPGAPLCQYCRTPSLREAEGRYLVACHNPAGCKDKDGRTPPTGILGVDEHARAVIE